MSRALVVILVTVGLDGAGMGLILPVLPDLLRDLAPPDRVAEHYGALAAGYALVQFLVAPALGALSDRFGRRPVLLVSLAGASVDYLVMALAPVLPVLYVGRLVAGVTGATMPVATAYIADVTPGGERAGRYGLMHACFGLGLIAGPALGGLVGQLSPRYPFLLAAALNGLNFLAGWVLLPESRSGGPSPLGLRGLNPLAALRTIGTLRGSFGLLTVYVVMDLVGQVPATLWVLSGQDRYGWGPATVGLSLAAFGLLRAISQAFVTGPVTAGLGGHRAVVLGVILDVGALLLLALATQGWMAFAAIPLLCLGRVATPALQALLSGRVGPDRQGQLQGALVGLSGLVAAVGPLASAVLYGATSAWWPGFVWLSAAALYLVCAPALARLWRSPTPGRS